jgi:hypothetical protein
MAKIHVGLNTEFSRSSDKPFEWAVQKAAEVHGKNIKLAIHTPSSPSPAAPHTGKMYPDTYQTMKRTLAVACISLKSAWQAVCRPISDQLRRLSPLRSGSFRSALTTLLLAPLAALHATRNLPGVPRFGILRAGSFQALETSGAMASNDWN